jgi:AraC family transcriptional activator of pobA
MARKARRAAYLPEILAVRQDEEEQGRRGGKGTRAPSDILSIYLQGGPRYRLGDRTYRFDPPVAILLPRGAIDHDMQEGDIRGIFVLFDGHGLVKSKRGSRGTVVVSMGSGSLSVPVLKRLSEADGERLASTVRDIGAVVGAGLAARMRRAALLFQALSDYCEAGGSVGRAGRHREAIRLRKLVEGWAFEHVPMSRIYRELDLSGAHAETLFKKAFGVTPVAYRNRLRLRRARELLVSSMMNVSQAAFAVGFKDPLYFSRVFYRAFGVRPSSLIRDFSGKRI